MAERPVCPQCERRRPERFCPAMGAKICAVCCGTEREVTFDCPVDCAYLVAAHRYEEEHRRPVAHSEIPFPDVDISEQFLYDRQPVLAAFAYTILNFAGTRRELTDGDVCDAVLALAETFRTLSSGIYYEKPPAAPLAASLYAALNELIQEYRKQQSERAGYPAIKDSDAFLLLVFLARMARSGSNGRPRSRMFLEFLRRQFPQPQTPQAATSRIISPDEAAGLILPGSRD